MKKENKIGALIVSFNPSIKLLQENINAIVNQVSTVVVVDNGSNNVNDVEKLLQNYGVSLIKLEKNFGIAAALNRGMEFLKKENFNWVLTLDQDSVVPKDIIQKLTDTKEFKIKNVGLIAADFINSAAGEISSERSGVVGYSRRVITSGSLTNVKVWSIIGGFDEQLFIDAVDHDFNQRIIQMGYDIFQINDVQIKHALGQSMKSNNNILAQIIGFFGSQRSEHSATRLYYIYRNEIIFIKRYSKRKTYDYLRLISDMRRLVIASHPIKQTKAALMGIKDGIKYSTKNDTFFRNYQEKVRLFSTKNLDEYK